MGIRESLEALDVVFDVDLAAGVPPVAGHDRLNQRVRLARAQAAEVGVGPPIGVPVSVEGPPPVDQVEENGSNDLEYVRSELTLEHSHLGSHRALGQGAQDVLPALPSERGPQPVLPTTHEVPRTII